MTNLEKAIEAAQAVVQDILADIAADAELPDKTGVWTRMGAHDAALMLERILLDVSDCVHREKILHIFRLRIARDSHIAAATAMEDAAEPVEVAYMQGFADTMTIAVGMFD